MQILNGISHKCAQYLCVFVCHNQLQSIVKYTYFKNFSTETKKFASLEPTWKAVNSDAKVPYWRSYAKVQFHDTVPLKTCLFTCKGGGKKTCGVTVL
jgi:hypothetical protein